MSEYCTERDRLETEWNQAIDRASNLEKEQHEATLAGHFVSDLTAKIQRGIRAN